MNNSLVTMPNNLTGTHCPTSTLATIGGNILEIRRCLGEMGYDISNVPSTLPLINYGILPNELKAKFTGYETRLWQIKQATDYITDNTYNSPYAYQWQTIPTDIRNQLVRWFRWSNEQKEVIDNQIAGTQPLCDNTSELSRDINGDIIYVEVE